MWVEDGLAAQAPYASKAEAIRGVARGLAHAHKHGVIHRDVRPMNIVVAKSGVVKLVNFDLALLKGYPEVGDPKGFAQRVDRRFSAPEVLANPGSATEASDIYSLGLVFHELMTGITPDGEAHSRAALNQDDIARAIRAAGPSGFERSPEDVAGVIARMCHPDPQKRYARMEEVKEDLAIIG
jgi:serine/threonine-protein kinase